MQRSARSAQIPAHRSAWAVPRAARAQVCQGVSVSHHNCAQECLVVMFQGFEAYCNNLIIAEGQGGGTSISRSTGQKIMQFLSSQPAHEVPKKFKHFVQKHEFRVRDDILCVPAKSREVRNHACHAIFF